MGWPAALPTMSQQAISSALMTPDMLRSGRCVNAAEYMRRHIFSMWCGFWPSM